MCVHESIVNRGGRCYFFFNVHDLISRISLFGPKRKYECLFKRTEGNSGHGLGRIGGTAPMEMPRERF